MDYVVLKTQYTIYFGIKMKQLMIITIIANKGKKEISKTKRGLASLGSLDHFSLNSLIFLFPDLSLFSVSPETSEPRNPNPVRGERSERVRPSKAGGDSGDDRRSSRR